MGVLGMLYDWWTREYHVNLNGANVDKAFSKGPVLKWDRDPLEDGSPSLFIYGGDAGTIRPVAGNTYRMGACGYINRGTINKLQKRLNPSKCQEILD